MFEILDNDLGLGLLPRHIHYNTIPMEIALFPSRSLLSMPTSGLSAAKQRRPNQKVSHIGSEGFQVSMDVSAFKPCELQVKVKDRSVIIEGSHEEREDDHGHISRHFVRRYVLPKGYDGDKVVSTLSSDGVLTVSAPKPAIEEKKDERLIQIQQVGPAHLNIKANGEEEQKEAKDEKNAENGEK